MKDEDINEYENDFEESDEELEEQNDESFVEQDITVNTTPQINNDINKPLNLKNRLKNDKSIKEKLENAKNNGLKLPFNHLKKAPSAEKTDGDSNEELSEDKTENSETANVFKRGIIKNPLNNILGQKNNSGKSDSIKAEIKKTAVSFIKRNPLAAVIIIVCISMFIIIMLVFLSSTEDDDSETRRNTDSYILGTGTESDLINYLILMGYCETEDTCKDTNAFKFYESFKKQYEGYQQGCPPNMGDSYLLNGGTPCEITVNVPVIFETLSYNLTDEEFFSSMSFGGDDYQKLDIKNVVTTKSSDIEKLALAMSEYVHEKCYQIETVEQCSNNSTSSTASSNIATSSTANSNNSGSTTNRTCRTVEVKKHKDLFYFQVSFDKYVSYLKYGDTSSHPNLSEKKPVILGNYEDRVCTGPQDDTITYGPSSAENGGSSDTSNAPTPINNGTTNEKLNALFPNGLPNSAAAMEQYLKTVNVSVSDINGNISTKSVTVHKDLAADIQQIFDQIAAAKFPIKDVYCFSWRAKAGGASGYSHHSFGVACDINANENYMVKNGQVVAGSHWKPGEDPYSITSDGPVVKAFANKGWTWGGTWRSSKDYMHFSYTGQ